MDRQEAQDYVFLIQLKQLIADYGGRDTFSKVLILENQEMFDYTQYKEALADSKACEVFEKKQIRNKTGKILPGNKLRNWGKDHEELLSQFSPERVVSLLEGQLSEDQVTRRKKILGIPSRKYKKSA